MKRFFGFLLPLLFICQFLSLKVCAASFVDDMTVIDNSGSKTYVNLTNQLASGSWSELPDNTFFAMQNSSLGKAEVIYRIQNANSVVVNIYSSNGTVVSRNEQGEYILSGMGSASGVLAKYSPSNNSAFIMAENKAKYLTYDRRKGYIFKDSQQYPQDLIPYGVTISTSTDGNSYKPASQSRLKSVFYNGAQLYSESWSAIVPSSATFLKIEINDVSFLESYDGTFNYPKIPTTMTMLSKIQIQGDHLIIGIPETPKTESQITTPPITSSTQPSSESSEQKKSTVSKTTTNKATAATPNSKSESSKKDSSVTSKFEGNIVSPTAPKKSTSNSGKSAIVASSKVKPEESSKESPIVEQPLYYINESSTESDSFSKGIIVYIIIVSLLILIILLRPKKI